MVYLFDRDNTVNHSNRIGDDVMQIEFIAVANFQLLFYRYFGFCVIYLNLKNKLRNDFWELSTRFLGLIHFMKCQGEVITTHRIKQHNEFRNNTECYYPL